MLKKVYALGLKFAKERVSSESGFFHWNYENTLSRDTIPLFENFCYVLALLRSHQSDLMLDARDILQRLLAFQGEGGMFPVYLHQYPKTYSRNLGVLQLAALFRIQDEYGHILGDKVRPLLGSAIKELINAVSLLELEGVRKYLADALLYKMGICGAPEEIPPFHSTKELNELIVANDLLSRTTTIPWHQELQIYTGPLALEKQDGFSPEISILDLLFREKVVVNTPIALFAELLLEPNIQASSEGGDYLFQCEPSNMRLCTKNHTLVIEQKGADLQRVPTENGVSFTLTLPKAPLSDDGKEVEWSIFVNDDPKVDFFVNGVKASMFYLHDNLTFVMDGRKFRLTVEVQSGSAHICGHLAKGNRSSQISPLAKTEWKAFDWQIAYRTLSRTENCTLLVTMREEPLHL